MSPRHVVPAAIIGQACAVAILFCLMVPFLAVAVIGRVILTVVRRLSAAEGMVKRTIVGETPDQRRPAERCLPETPPD